MYLINKNLLHTDFYLILKNTVAIEVLFEVKRKTRNQTPKVCSKESLHVHTPHFPAFDLGLLRCTIPKPKVEKM